MIIVLKPGAPEAESKKLKEMLLREGFQINEIVGVNMTILGVIGDTSAFDPKRITVNDYVEKVMRVQEPFKRANRMFHPENSIVDVSGVKIGGKKLAVIAGPCSIETDEQMNSVAKSVKEAGASLLRGGAFKPRTSPYSFQGLENKGLEYLAEAREVTGLKVVTEVTEVEAVDAVAHYADILQIGARNMQNFRLLKEVGRCNKPVMLKRGLCATIDEWLNAAEYIMNEGNHNVILCERGIRTYETYTRNTLDMSAVAAVKHLSHLPIIVDPSHGTGKWRMVKPMSFAAIAAGADGLIIEVHPNPAKALSDGPQSLTPENYREVMRGVYKISDFMKAENLFTDYMKD